VKLFGFIQGLESKAKFKEPHFVAILLAGILFLTGCSSNSESTSAVSGLKDKAGTCATVKNQVANFVSTIEQNGKYSEWEQFKLLTGKDQRADMVKNIYTVAPFLKDAKFSELPYLPTAVGAERELYSDAEQELDLLEFFFKKTEGEILSTKARDDYLHGDWLEQGEYVGPVVANIFGSYFGEPMIGDPSADPGVCGSGFDWNYWNEKVLWSYGDALNTLEWMKDCEEKTYGDCSNKKYVDNGSTTVNTSCADVKLKITVNDNEPGVSCGKLSFSIFQADKNTGDCLALGYWNDRNGSQQVGAFFSCGLEEGSSYTAAVKVGNPYTYTNSYNVEKTVISFSLN
jgi:hypothetical protein